MAIAKKTYFLNADRSKTVAEDSKDAAFLLVREGGQISDEDAERYGVDTEAEAERPAEEPNIVISGGRNSGPAIVRGEPLEGQQEGQTGETRVESTEGASTARGAESTSEGKQGTRTASKKSGRK